MRKQLIVASLAVCLPVTSALAAGWRDFATSAGISASLYSTFRDHKIVYAAKDDASSFVASNGEIRGPYLESVLNSVRSENPDTTASDMEIATAILTAQEPVADR